MTMREKMARGIARLEVEPLLEVLSDPVADNMFDAMWDRDISELRTRGFIQADAALDALMEPTGFMLAIVSAQKRYPESEYPIGLGENRNWHNNLSSEHALFYWKKMIQAAKDGK